MSSRPYARRVMIGRNIVLGTAAVYALSRALYYATINTLTVTPAQGVITDDGRLLGAWAAIWLIAAVFCVADMVNRHTRHGLSAVVGLAFAWGLGYAIIWALSGFTDQTLLSTAISWMTPAGLGFGMLIKITALQDMLRTRGEEPGD